MSALLQKEGTLIVCNPLFSLVRRDKLHFDVAVLLFKIYTHYCG